MQFKLWINTDNAAFDSESGGDKSAELARILRGIADKIERDGVAWHYQTIYDINGNDVGRFAEKEKSQ